MREERSTDRNPAVPFVDLSAVHAELRLRILEDVASLIETGDFVNGPAVAQFEAELARYCGSRHCVGLSSGLDALRLGLLALGVGPGDDVVAPAHTFVATIEAITQTGARPVLVDISDADYGIDPAAAQAVLTSRTRALVCVHLYGQMADLGRLNTVVAEANDVALVEDAAQAHGAERDGLRAGAVGTIGAFSFYPAKNLGALGDAGAATTNDSELARTMRALREHGQFIKNEHALDGYTARLDTIQAHVLLHKLPLLDDWNEQRREAAVFYNHYLANVGDLRLPSVPPGSRPVWHLYVVRTADPDALAGFLGERGVASGRHYPQPVHLAPALAHLGYRAGEFPVAEGAAAGVLSLPIFPGISEAQLEKVVATTRAYFD